MARYAIKAYECMYEGLHGMYTTCVVDSNNINDVFAQAVEESYEVMDSYSAIFSSLCDEAAEELGIEYEVMDSWNNEEFCQCVDELRTDNLAYEIYQLDDEATAMADYDVENALYDNWDEFIEAHGTKI